jgi:ATP dependent DNA ligase-like protein
MNQASGIWSPRRCMPLTRARYGREHRPTRESFPRDRDSANLRASAFDVLRLAGTTTLTWPYSRRRAALEELFHEHQLTAPWALCPSTTDPDTVHEWLTSWTAAGLEGVVFKRLDSPYRPSARGWLKYKVRETTEAIVGAVTGPATAPRTLLLGRYDTIGHFQYTGRITVLPQTVAALSPVYSLLQRQATRGRAGRSLPGEATGRHWTSPSSSPNWSWKSASTSPTTPPADGATPPAGTAHAPTSPPPTSHSSFNSPR